jgi:predicted RNA-binding Zn-ribbon protein involved in translation (DUF1610 family)
MNMSNMKHQSGCSGGNKWPISDASGHHCPDCGKLFQRSELRGRDDHMPLHFMPPADLADIGEALNQELPA